MVPDTSAQVSSTFVSGVHVFLMTDIEGSTFRWEEMPSAMRVALQRHDEILNEAIRANNGHVFKTVGDAFHAVFISPSSAVAAALQAQRALVAEDFSATDGLRVRIVVHAGPAEVRGSDFFGPGLNRASRLLVVAYGGQILVSGTVADLLQGRLPANTSLFDLGRHRFRDLQESEQVYQLVAEGIESAFPPLRSLGAKPNHLPHPLTPMIGREKEVEEIRARLAHSRLLTLIGSGGAGKTRLAIELGYALAESYPDGVWFVELGRLDDPKLVAEQICGTIGVAVLGGRAAVESAVGYLREKRALLILDSCEHLIGAAATIAEAISSECAEMSVLSTSREPLGVSGESVFRVPNLAVPDSDDVSRESAMGYSAIQLFLARANAVAETLDMTDENLAAVISICGQLDGIPLAIELAAPRLRTMRADTLASRLRDRFRLLATGARTVPARHRTMQTLFEWSYNLLDEREQTLLRRLSVFAGGWTVESAAAVVSGDPIDEEDVFDLIASLADKSLVVADTSLEETRYRLLETTRQYGFEKLREAREVGRRRRLAEYVLRFHREAERSWPTMPTEQWIGRFKAEIDNLRASLEWAFSAEGDFAIGLELASYSLRIWDEVALLPERERWFATAVAALDEATPGDVKARLWLGRTSVSAHGGRSSFEAATRAAAHFRTLDDPLGLGEALTKAGAAILTPANCDEALPFLEEALGILERQGPSKQLASCQRSCGVAAYFGGDFAQAQRLITQSAQTARAVGDGQGLINALIATGELEFASGNVEAAIDSVRKVIEHPACNRRQLALGLGNLTAYLIASGRLPEAKLTAYNGLHKARSLGWPAAIARMAEHLALILALEGDLEGATFLLGYSEHFYSAGTASRDITEQVGYDRLRAILSEQNGAFAHLAAEGAASSEADVIRRAMRSQSSFSRPADPRGMHSTV
jgi:predicted ATPase/class 3 adenylate cyclase